MLSESRTHQGQHRSGAPQLTAPRGVTEGRDAGDADGQAQ